MLQYDYGIYEQQTIASAPSILIRAGATASVVTRYWGRPPANLSVPGFPSYVSQGLQKYELFEKTPVRLQSHA